MSDDQSCETWEQAREGEKQVHDESNMTICGYVCDVRCVYDFFSCFSLGIHEKQNVIQSHAYGSEH